MSVVLVKDIHRICLANAYVHTIKAGLSLGLFSIVFHSFYVLVFDFISTILVRYMNDVSVSNKVIRVQFYDLWYNLHSGNIVGVYKSLC